MFSYIYADHEGMKIYAVSKSEKDINLTAIRHIQDMMFGQPKSDAAQSVVNILKTNDAALAIQAWTDYYMKYAQCPSPFIYQKISPVVV